MYMSSIRMKRKYDLNDFDYGMGAAASWADLSTSALPGFKQNIL